MSSELDGLPSIVDLIQRAQSVWAVDLFCATSSLASPADEGIAPFPRTSRPLMTRGVNPVFKLEP